MDVCVQSQLHTGLEAPGRTLCLKNLCSLPITWPPPTVTASLVWVCRMPTACKGLSGGGGGSHVQAFLQTQQPQRGSLEIKTG